MRKTGNIPTSDTVTGIALSIGCDMSAVLTGCRSTVMTGVTSLRDTVMGEIGDPPVTGGMTTVALFSCLNMSG
jgi:hypothetical protein